MRRRKPLLLPGELPEHDQVRILSWTPVSSSLINLFGILEAEVDGELVRLFLRRVRNRSRWVLTRWPGSRDIRRALPEDQGLLRSLDEWFQGVPCREFVAWPLGGPVLPGRVIAYQCPWCAREHFHGIPARTGAGSNRARADHCSAPFHRPEYVLGQARTDGVGYPGENWTLYHDGSKFVRETTTPEWLKLVLWEQRTDLRPCEGMLGPKT